MPNDLIYPEQDKQRDMIPEIRITSTPGCNSCTPTFWGLIDSRTEIPSECHSAPLGTNASTGCGLQHGSSFFLFVWTERYNLSDIAQPFTLHIWINKHCAVSLGAARLVKWIRKPWKYCLPLVHQLLDNYSRPSCKKNRWWVSISTVDFFALMQS